MPTVIHVPEMSITEVILANMRGEEFADRLQVGLFNQRRVTQVANGLVLPLSPVEGPDEVVVIQRTHESARWLRESHVGHLTRSACESLAATVFSELEARLLQNRQEREDRVDVGPVRHGLFWLRHGVVSQWSVSRSGGGLRLSDVRRLICHAWATPGQRRVAARSRGPRR